MGRLDGKVAIVLGAAGHANMGQGIARRFVDEGARVVVGGRNMDILQPFADEIGAKAYRLDITSQEDVNGIVDFARQTFGKVDIGLNATGWGLLKPLLDTTLEEMEKMSAIQLHGPFLFAQALIRAMDNGGSIIQISSATATIMLENHAAYMATKAGTNHLIRVIANEFGSKGIRANTIAPGVTETPMAGGTLDVPAIRQAFTKEYPLGRVGTIEDIAAAAVWLASDECFMTGEVLQVNGGLTLRRNPFWSEFAAGHEGAFDHLAS